MRRPFVFIVIVFFGFVSVIMAQQDVGNYVSSPDQDASEPLLMEPPAGSDMYPVIRETADILREILDRAQVGKFAEQNPDLMQEVNDVIKRDEEALNEFDALMQFPDPDQPLVEGPISFDMHAVACESLDTLEELLNKVQGCKFVEENLELIERAENVVKRDSQTLKELAP